MADARDPSLARINLDQLWLPFRNKLVLLIGACRARGAEYVALSGFRSVQEQDRLYAQGRTKPGKVVTKARGAESFHNFGVAVDFVSMISGKPNWDDENYEVLAEEAERLGLESGLRWHFKDAGHVQWPHLDLNILNAQQSVGGQPQVISYLDRHHP